jgi:hypothetical protein
MFCSQRQDTGNSQFGGGTMKWSSRTKNLLQNIRILLTSIGRQTGGILRRHCIGISVLYPCLPRIISMLGQTVEQGLYHTRSFLWRHLRVILRMRLLHSLRWGILHELLIMLPCLLLRNLPIRTLIPCIRIVLVLLLIIVTKWSHNAYAFLVYPLLFLHSSARLLNRLYKDLHASGMHSVSQITSPSPAVICQINYGSSHAQSHKSSQTTGSIAWYYYDSTRQIISSLCLAQYQEKGHH